MNCIGEVADLHYTAVEQWYPEYTLVATDPRDPPARRRLGQGSYSKQPTTGCSAAPATLISALEITIHPAARGTGLSDVMLDALRRNTKRLGHDQLVAPVRPNAKHTEPATPMAEYAHRARQDGLSTDPWLRVHARAGGTIAGIAPYSMTIPGTLALWRDWAGLPFDTTGPVTVPAALTPVHCDITADHAVYVEPNVWIRHQL